MNIEDVVTVPRTRDRKFRVGRGNGSGNGKTSGRGMRGAKCRTGAGGKLTYQGGQMPLFRAIPRRGFNNRRFQVGCELVNVDKLARFESGAEVTPETLKAAGLVSARAEVVKILADGRLDKALTVKAHKFSKAAIGKIEAAGGKAEVIQ